MNWFIGHLAGDYLLQDDYQALNKKKSSLACGVHVLLYSLSVWAFTHWPWWAMGVTALCHFVQDRTTVVVWFMHATNKKKFAQPPTAPWSVIVVDNTLHLLQLYLTAAAVARWPT